VERCTPGVMISKHCDGFVVLGEIKGVRFPGRHAFAVSSRVLIRGEFPVYYCQVNIVI